MNSHFFLLASRNLFRQRKRTAIAMSSIVFGVVALLLAGGFIEWGLWFGRDSTIHSQLGHLQITKPKYYSIGISDPFQYLLPVDEAPQFKAIRALPQVKAVGPRLALTGLISHADSSISFIGEGVDPEAETFLSRSIAIREGEGLSVADPKGAILGVGLAANLGVGVGDSVVLLATTGGGGINAVEVRVRGVFSTITKAYDDAALRIPIVTARKLLRVDGAHIWAVLLKEDESAHKQVDGFRSLLSPVGFQVLEWRDLADFFNKTEALLSQQFAVVKVIIAIIILLSISNTMMMAVMERTSEIGTVMAIGAPAKDVMSMFVVEGLILGVVGSLTGLCFGYLLASLISYIGIPMPPAPGMAEAYTARILLTWPLVIESGAIVLQTTLFASIYPAWKASRMVIVDALRQSN
jgi:putative ABC transport system permease protein